LGRIFWKTLRVEGKSEWRGLTRPHCLGFDEWTIPLQGGTVSSEFPLYSFPSFPLCKIRYGCVITWNICWGMNERGRLWACEGMCVSQSSSDSTAGQ
jgi:hypothetical protein